MKRLKLDTAWAKYEAFNDLIKLVSYCYFGDDEGLEFYTGYFGIKLKEGMDKSLSNLIESADPNQIKEIDVFDDRDDNERKTTRSRVVLFLLGSHFKCHELFTHMRILTGIDFKTADFHLLGKSIRSLDDELIGKFYSKWCFHINQCEDSD